MVWNRTRQFLLPAALSVTSFGVVLACGGEDDEPTQSTAALEECADKPAASCQRCKDTDGKATCGPAKDCYAEVGNKCSPGGTS
jgi:hypothetical protein